MRGTTGCLRCIVGCSVQYNYSPNSGNYVPHGQGFIVILGH